MASETAAHGLSSLLLRKSAVSVPIRQPGIFILKFHEYLWLGEDRYVTFKDGGRWLQASMPWTPQTTAWPPYC